MSFQNARRLHYRAERQELVKPGYYRLECAARANGEGVLIYMNNPMNHNSTFYHSVPALGNEGGDLGKGWSKITIDSVLVNSSVRRVDYCKVSYGVTTFMNKMPDRCRATWLSATDFKLTRIGDLPEHGAH